MPTSPQPFNPTSLGTTRCREGKRPTRKRGTGLKTTSLLFSLGIGSGLVWIVSSGKMDFSTISPEGKVHSAPQKLTPQDGATEKTQTATMYNRAHLINWPIIALTGIASGMDKKSQSAILNGQLIRPHQTIQKVRLVVVTPVGVILEYRNSRKMIHVGEST